MGSRIGLKIESLNVIWCIFVSKQQRYLWFLMLSTNLICSMKCKEQLTEHDKIETQNISIHSGLELLLTFSEHITVV